MLVLIDITSALDQRARDLLNDGVQTVLAQLQPGERLRIATITDQVTTSTKLVEQCVPWCPSGLIDILLGSCTEGLLRVENRRLQSEVEVALRANLTATSDLPYSEILRTISANAQLRNPHRHLELYVFSDLIENSEFIPGKEFWSTPARKLLARLSDTRLVPRLSDTTVHAFGMGRGGSGERKALPPARMAILTGFWTAYFEAAGTTDVTLSEFLAAP